MTDSGTNRSKKSYRKSFIILPIVFLLIGYLLFFICLTPILSPLVSIYELAFSNANVNTIVEPGKTVLLMVAAVWITVILHRVI